jgi:hypothetical protein
MATGWLRGTVRLILVYAFVCYSLLAVCPYAGGCLAPKVNLHHGLISYVQSP